MTRDLFHPEESPRDEPPEDAVECQYCGRMSHDKMCTRCQRMDEEMRDED